jgi:hypothetical protein
MAREVKASNQEVNLLDENIDAEAMSFNDLNENPDFANMHAIGCALLGLNED